MDFSSGSERWAFVGDLLAGALALPSAQRSAFLDERCSGEPELRSEIEDLIRVADQPAFLDRPLLRDRAATEANPVGDLAGSLPAGHQFLHYRIVSKIGEGGMGAVYKAVDINLDRTVGLKVISRGSITPQDRARFAREAKSASALNHPNIVTIYEYNSVDGVDFIAMEYVEGAPLDKVLEASKTGGRDLRGLLGYASQVASALAEAHSAGIVHRDLKPGNIMVTPDGRAKVLDFGLAKRHATEGPGSASAETETALTEVGYVVGTPAYMSPQQAMGEGIDWRTDVFSFGVILYEMVCGVRPFRGPNRMSVLTQVIHSDPQPVRELNPGAPFALEGLITRCMEKDVTKRLQTLSEVPAVIASIGGGETWLGRVLPRLPRLSRRRLAALGVTALACAVALVPSSRRAVVDRASLLIRGAEQGPTGTPPELTLQARQLLLRYDKAGNLDQAIGLAEAALARDSSFAPAYAALSEAYFKRSAGSSDGHWLKMAEESARQSVSANPDLAAAHEALATVLLETARAADAKKELDRALELDPLSASAHVTLAKLSAREDPAASARYFSRAVELAPDNWIPRLEFGIFHYRNARYADAAGQWEAALKLAPGNVRLLRNLAAAHHMVGDHDRAVSTLQEILNLDPSAGGWNNLGTALFFQGKYSESVSAFDHAVALDASNYLYWGNLGDARRWAPGQRQRASAAYQQAVSLLRENIARKPEDAEAGSRLALYLAKLGDRKDAFAELARVGRLKNTNPTAFFKISIAHELLGDRDKALQSLATALRAGYSIREIRTEPELVSLRADERYRRLIAKANE